MSKYGGRAMAGGKGGARSLALLVAAAWMGAYGTAGAFEIPTGSDDVAIRWDNTLRYTYGYRVEGRDKRIIGDPNTDDGDRNLDVGTVSNRIDLLSEFDVVYKSNYGVRLSGAGWYDQRYDDKFDNDSPGTSNHLKNGVPATGLSSYTRRYFAGPSGELQDAFAFGKFYLGQVPVNIKVGRHTVYWGESMLGNGGTHGISYGQSAIDIPKGLAQPSVELKELFRPRNQVSMQIQPTRELSIAGQYYLEWEANRFPEPGTNLSWADVLGNGSESLVAGPPFHDRVVNGKDIEPSQTGDWGLAAKWSPDWLEGTLGLYFRRFSDVNGQLHLGLGAVPVPGAPPGTIAVTPTEYHWAYASGINLYGMSLAKQVAGVSVGAEISYRENMPLWSAAAVIPTGGQFPDGGDTFGARGDTWHGLVNFLYLFGRTPLYDKATGLAEFTWNRLSHVTSHPELFKTGSAYAWNDRATKDYFGSQVNYEPVWFQVISGVDLSMPLSWAMGLSGNSCVTSGGTEGAGTYSAGLTADVFQKYKVNLSYIGFFGPLGTDPSSGGLTTGNGPYPGLRDRDMVTLTLKTTF
jgi:hypothetical protein